jgi:AcrR family transcriptional regulator
MARPVVINDDTLLQAARDVLLEKGVGATSADVAKRAKVSEGSLFRRYPSKMELFHAALTHRMSDVPDFILRLPERTGRSTLAQELEGAAVEAIAFLRVLVPVIMMSWSNRKTGLSMDTDENGEPGHLRAYRGMASWFEAEKRIGRFNKKIDVDIAAHLFLGALYNWVNFETMREERSTDVEMKAFVRRCVFTVCAGFHELPKAPRTAR